MAIDVCAETSSPRISFSYDLNPEAEEDEERAVTKRTDAALLESDFNFSFSVNRSTSISPADEIFSAGQIAPLCTMRPANDAVILPSDDAPRLRRAVSADQVSAKKKMLKDYLTVSQEEESNSLTFCQFMRTNSVNRSSLTQGKDLLRRLQPQRKSFSTPSHIYGPPHSTTLNYFPKQNPCASYGSTLNTTQATRKHGTYGIGRGYIVTPILNISPPYISIGGTERLFSFCCGKIKSKKTTKYKQ